MSSSTRGHGFNKLTAVTDAFLPQDVINSYRLALGREPESEEVIADKLRQPRDGLLADCFSSGEFEDGVRPKLVSGALDHPTFRMPPDEPLKAWVARFAPLAARA